LIDILCKKSGLVQFPVIPIISYQRLSTQLGTQLESEVDETQGLPSS